MKKEKNIIPQPDEAVFDAFFQSIPVPMFLLDEKRRVNRMTPRAREVFSNILNEEEGNPLGRIINCIHALDDPRGCGFTDFCPDCSVRKTISEVYRTGKACYQKEVKITIGKKSLDYYLIISANTVNLPFGRRILLYFEDITDSKLAEKKLKFAKENLNRAQTVAHIGSWHLDIADNNLFWSDEAYRIFGLDIESPLTYEKFLNMVHPDDREYVNKSWQAALCQEPYDIEHRIVVEGKVKWIREKAHVEFDRKSKPVRGVGVVQDITEVKQKEEDFRKLQNELAHISRVTVMGEFTAALAHELNQPLMAIMSNAQAAQRFLEKENPDLAEIKEIFSDIVKDDKRAGDVITRLKALLRKSELEFTILNINELISEVISLVRGDIVIKKVLLTTAFDEKNFLIKGDRVQLQQVILNLILNSFEAMKSRDSKKLFIKTKKKNEKSVIVSIEDSGPGIDQKVINRLFEPFFTTKKEGMGMGLAINKAIIVSHGGSLWAKNNPDKGAAFYFTLPIAKGNTGGKL